MSSHIARTVWVLGDQLNRNLAHLRTARPSQTRVLFIISLDKLRRAPWHQQRLHFILTAMRRLANELTDEGFSVDWRVAETMRQGVSAHLEEFSPEYISVMQPMNRAGQRLIDSLSATMPITVTPSDQFLCSREEFAEWASANTTNGLEIMECLRSEHHPTDDAAGDRCHYHTQQNCLGQTQGQPLQLGLL